MNLSILIAAGGTGGHMVPAHALSEELLRRGHRVTLLTDARGLRFPGLFERTEKHVLASATARGLDPLAWIRALFAVYKGRAQGKRIAKDVGADAVVGFGGYPSLPGLLAGVALRLPAVLHEQNAVLGRANRRLQARVSAIALSYAQTQFLNPAFGGKTHVTGNPVRAEILAAREHAYAPPAAGEKLKLLVIGGSQGARILSQLVPDAVAALPAEQRARLDITQQCREEDLTGVFERYREMGVTAECLAYMADLPRRLAAAHLVVGRSGASTMAELTAMGRPAIVVPFPAATDDHQTANAAAFIDAGAGMMLPEAGATAAKLAGMLTGFLKAPEVLSGAAAAARRLGHADAAVKLADLVEKEVRDAG